MMEEYKLTLTINVGLEQRPRENVLKGRFAQFGFLVKDLENKWNLLKAEGFQLKSQENIFQDFFEFLEAIEFQKPIFLENTSKIKTARISLNFTEVREHLSKYCDVNVSCSKTVLKLEEKKKGLGQ